MNCEKRMQISDMTVEGKPIVLYEQYYGFWKIVANLKPFEFELEKKTFVTRNTKADVTKLSHDFFKRISFNDDEKKIRISNIFQIFMF